MFLSAFGFSGLHLACSINMINSWLGVATLNLELLLNFCTTNGIEMSDGHLIGCLEEFLLRLTPQSFHKLLIEGHWRRMLEDWFFDYFLLASI